jgi:hypothetical protein
VIDKIRKGRNVTRLLYYLYSPGKSDEHTDPHLIAAWRDDLPWLEPPVRPGGTRDFRRLTSLLEVPLKMTGRNGRDATVWHCVLSAAPADALMSDEQWNAIAAGFMDLMGLAPRDDPAGVRWVAVRHGLSSGGIDHVHIVATLARQDGTIPSVHNDFVRARRACRQIERRYGLTVTAPADRTAAVRPSRAETERSARSGTPEPLRVTLRRQVQEAAAIAVSEEDFFARLRDAGVVIRFRYSDRVPGQVTGYAVALPGHVSRAGTSVWFGGGKLAPDLTLPKLRHRWERPWDDPLAEVRMSARAAKAALRSAAWTAAERSRDEGGYFAALRQAGVLIRYRYSQVQPDEVTGYALGAPGCLDGNGRQLWYSGGQLAGTLTLPRLQRRWAAPEGSIRPPVTPTERQALWADIITATSHAVEQMRTDHRTAADTAWATADLLRGAARAIRGPAGRELRHAADDFDRAAREAHIVVPRPTPPGDVLRAAARMLGITQPGSTARSLQVLLTVLADLVAASAELRDIQRRRHQAAAARAAGARLNRLRQRVGSDAETAVANTGYPDRDSARIAGADIPRAAGLPRDEAGRPEQPALERRRRQHGMDRPHGPAP